MPFKHLADRTTATREWRERNPEKYREYSRRASAKAYAEKKSLLKKIKDVPCMDCGQRFPPCVMDFDHRDPTTKTTEVARLMTGSWGFQRVLAEIEKCDIVCANCHRVRTFGKD